MFYRFNAHRVGKPAPKPDDTLANLIYQSLSSVQRGWADYMNARAKRLDTKRLKAVSAVLLTAASGYFIYLIFTGFVSDSALKTRLENWYRLSSDSYPDKRQQKQLDMKLYLDSLEKAVIKDSLNHLKQREK